METRKSNWGDSVQTRSEDPVLSVSEVFTGYVGGETFLSSPHLRLLIPMA